MLHPSYVELMEAINKNADNGGEPVVTSRYSVVIAAAKRARQLIEHGSGLPEEYQEKKALSVAVSELLSGDVKILPPDDFEFDYDDQESSIGGDTVYDLTIDEDEDESEEYEDEEDSRDFDDDSSEFLEGEFDDSAEENSDADKPEEFDE